MIIIAAFFLVLAGFSPTLTGLNEVSAAPPPLSFADLAKKLSPTVVNIYTTQTVKVGGKSFGFSLPDNNDVPEPFRRFFNNPGHPNLENEHDMKRTSLGSGIITSADGYILTNNHVVEDADEINVKLSTFEEYTAKLIGRDAKTDLALIKIEPKENSLPFVTFGDSDVLQVGDWVLAIGNPFGLEQTVTAGIVSAKGRSINNESFGNFIQTDASINQGNSGGPLFDLNGEMIGVNTAIFSRSGGNIGIGFAIPVNMATNVLKQLKENGTVVRGWLGVMIQHVSADLAKNFGLERPIGALVGEVVKDSPAEKAGIKQGDIIIKYKDKEISKMSMLPAIVAQSPVGEIADVTIIRDGKEKIITVTISKLNEEAVDIPTSEAPSDRDLGLTIQEITPDLAESLSLEEKSGLIVTDVEEGSPGGEAGIERGDIILEVDRKQVDTIKNLKKQLEKSKKNDSVVLLMKRDEHTRYVVIKTK